MKLLREKVEEFRPVIEEATEGKPKKYFVEGIFMQADRKNRNGRVYPNDILQRECARYVKENVVEKRAYGELGHPDNPGINWDRVSHVITELKQDGCNYVGKAMLLNNERSNFVKDLIENGCKFGMSTRGVGSLKEHNGHQQVCEDYMLMTAGDIVHDPSAPDAWMTGLMENAEWVCENGVWSRAQTERAQKLVHESSRADREQLLEKLFANFMHKLSNR
jgi:hypothetical protein